MCVTGAFVDVAAAVGNGAMVSRETSPCWCSIVGTSPAEAGTAGEAAGAVAGGFRRGSLRCHDVERDRCKGDFFQIGLNSRLMLFELRDGKARGGLDRERIFGQAYGARLPQHVDEACILAVALAKGDGIPQDDACFLVHCLSRSLALSSHASGAEFGQMVFLAMLDDQAGLRQVIERA